MAAYASELIIANLDDVKHPGGFIQKGFMPQLDLLRGRIDYEVPRLNVCVHVVFNPRDAGA